MPLDLKSMQSVGFMQLIDSILYEYAQDIGVEVGHRDFQKADAVVSQDMYFETSKVQRFSFD